MKFLRSKRGIGAIAAVLLVLFLFRPGVYRLRNRIANSIGSALGRRVSLDNVHFQILPRPGFDLEGLVIYDDPSFSAEPMIRAQEVFAAIRIRSLFWGHLEIARLSATEPSINITRNNEGRWNLFSLIERNAQIPVAPTQKSASERRPAFPYLEATSARINFKIGPEKKFYALTDADVALWQDSENSWGARMKAQPVRIDFNLTDTGLVQINANWQRAANLYQTPMRLNVAWQKGQLGQITKLLTGRDRGWRGGVNFTASFSGTPQGLTVVSRSAITGFRRYDILDSRNINLSTSCTGTYNAVGRSLTNLLCQSPVAGGMLRLSGGLGPMRPDPVYDLTLAAEKVPIASALELLHESKQQLPADLTASGLFDAEFHAVRNGPDPAKFSGNGGATDLHLLSNSGKDRVVIANLPLTLLSDLRSGNPGAKPRKKEDADSEPSEAHLRIGPAAAAVNSSAPLNAGGWLSASGYRFFVRGDAELKNLFRLETTLGVSSARPAAEGDVRLDVSISGAWKGLAPPMALGTAQLHNVRAETRGLNAPIQISSATVVLAPDVFSLQKLSAQTGSTHWSGSVSAPRHCAPACVFDFDLTADQLASADLAEWFTPQAAKRAWYRILSSSDQQGPSPFLALQAHGSLHVARLEIKKLLTTQLVTHLDIDRGKIMLTRLRAGLLQGGYQGNWTIDASTLPLHYRGAGTLQNIALAQLGALMNDAWIAGNADGSFEVDASGTTWPDLLTNSEGKLQFVMRNGSLAHVHLPGAPSPLPVHRFAGDLRVKKGLWQLSAGRLESRDGLYQVSGTAAPDRGLDFVFTRGDERSWNLTGTLTRPHVSPANLVSAKREIPRSTQ